MAAVLTNASYLGDILSSQGLFEVHAIVVVFYIHPQVVHPSGFTSLILDPSRLMQSNRS
jgi:hypothetical protein